MIHSSKIWVQFNGNNSVVHRILFESLRKPRTPLSIFISSQFATFTPAQCMCLNQNIKVHICIFMYSSAAAAAALLIYSDQQHKNVMYSSYQIFNENVYLMLNENQNLLRSVYDNTWSFKGLAQNSLSSPPASSWTFTGPGDLEVYPDLDASENQEYGLKFRTREPFGVLFCHMLKDYVPKENSQLQRYKLCVELQSGYIHVTYHLNQYRDSIKLGEVLCELIQQCCSSILNDDSWHNLQILLNVADGRLTVNLDNTTRSHYLQAYKWSSPKTILVWNNIPSIIIYGGVRERSSRYFQFIGCLKDIYLLEKNNNKTLLREDSNIEITGVSPGCQNRCETDNPCHKGTKCVNLYKDIVCDCFGSDHEGKNCQDVGATAITLHGYEWITYEQYNEEYGNSDRPAGVLLYAVGASPYHSHVIASVHDGIVFTSVAFDDNILEAELGLGVDDSRWHNLTIIHNKMEVIFELDGQTRTRRVTSQHHYLTLNPKIYFGGGDNLVTTLGLREKKNFVGCLKNIHVNEYSILYQMKAKNPRCQYSGGSKVVFGCRTVDNIPLSFQQSSSMLIVERDVGNYMKVHFDFKTVREEAILFYVDLITSDPNVSTDYGYLEVWMKFGKAILKYVPSSKDPSHTQTCEIPVAFYKSQWHSLEVEFNKGEAKLSVNKLSRPPLEDRKGLLKVFGRMVIGYGLRKYGANEGFVGCIKNLYIQNEAIDPINLSELSGIKVYGVKLDGCKLVDHCLGGTHCEHGGKCVSNWNGVICDCSKTPYIGKACHFPKYKRTCDSYYQAGMTESGVYQLDLDGTGPLDPTYVNCNMGYKYRDELYGKTVIDNNFDAKTKIRDSALLLQLTDQSTWCRQYVQYDCYDAPLKLGDETFFKAANGEVVEYIGADKPGKCLCSLNSSCSQDKGCNCDSSMKNWQQDCGYNTKKTQLPITEITVLQSTRKSSAKALLTLGQLECWGTNRQSPAKSVTFKTATSFIQLAPWTTGDLQFSFRTHQQRALLLYQSAVSANTNYLKITLISATKIRFQFHISGSRFSKDLEFSRPLNTGDWQLVTVELDRYNIRCSVNSKQEMYNIPKVLSSRPTFSGVLFIGGHRPEITLDDTTGLVGCMRGLMYNDKFHDLTTFIDPRCNCTNPWAHSGHNCGININEDTVTFKGTSTSYLEVDAPVDEHLLKSNIILSFRTFKPSALLLYMYDELNNFVQLEIKGGTRLVLSYNHFEKIISDSIEIGGLTNGQWRQVVIDGSLEHSVKLMVDSKDHTGSQQIFFYPFSSDAVDVNCNSGCDSKPCLNEGYCIEKWGNSQFQCDCSESDHAGKRCELEASGVFTGRSVVEHEFSPPDFYQQTRKERIEFVFKTNATGDDSMVLFLVQSSRNSHDYVIIHIKPNQGLFVNSVEGMARLDLQGIAKVPRTDEPMIGLDTIMVGGIIPDKVFIDQVSAYRNFTGCISEVKFIPVSGYTYRVQSMKNLRNNRNDITVYGDQSILTMPPWNPGPPEIIYLSGTPAPPTVPSTTVSIRTTLQPTTAGSGKSNMTRAIMDIPSYSIDERTIGIALSLVTFFFLAAIIIAFILIRLRHRQSYSLKKKNPDDLEMKQPLNQAASPQMKSHLATFDEFSMVSATIGPSMRRKENGTKPEPYLDDIPPDYPMRLFNQKKNRPASSISEVLEEMERQRKAKEIGMDPGREQESPKSAHSGSCQTHGEGDLEWDPQTDRTPLTCAFPPFPPTIYEVGSYYEVGIFIFVTAMLVILII
ncbi:hypothetical protein KUTeg_015918 [Tegillarca granosa]|uniref:Uncharacterized protein n=1 Tax=Tegillarca granosa TaxID=220873 RepID=A0ABQ9EJC6_TEGGR|nr:hypothetical protein KUTeg_015918 [Tegillarca granosa]